MSTPLQIQQVLNSAKAASRERDVRRVRAELDKVEAMGVDQLDISDYFTYKRLRAAELSFSGEKGLSFAIVEDLIALAESHGLIVEQASCYLMLGALCSALSQSAEALSWFSTCKDFSHARSLHALEARAYGSIAHELVQLGELEKSNKAFLFTLDNLSDFLENATTYVWQSTTWLHYSSD